MVIGIVAIVVIYNYNASADTSFNLWRTMLLGTAVGVGYIISRGIVRLHAGRSIELTSLSRSFMTRFSTHRVDATVGPWERLSAPSSRSPEKFTAFPRGETEAPRQSPINCSDVKTRYHVAAHESLAAWSGVPFACSSVSTIFFALSQEPPAFAMKIAW